MRNARWEASNSSNVRRTESLRHSSHTVTNPDMRSAPLLMNLLDESRNASQGTEAPSPTAPVRDLATGYLGIDLLNRNTLNIVDTGRRNTHGQHLRSGVTAIKILVDRNRDVPTLGIGCWSVRIIPLFSVEEIEQVTECSIP